MEFYFLLIVGVLFLLAISDLIVGVSNDAVNFLNSAIGSRAGSFRLILAVAAVGVLVGAVFSNGMMEVARKGIFNPQMFSFNHIMVIFLAVMMTDILLLDFFNTIGLPTSTTVSIVFELLGSAVAISIFKISKAGESISRLGEHINTERAVIIVAGIFLSVVVAFTVGMIVQWIVRLAFSFKLKQTFRYWSGIWGGFAITAILYFLLIKGAHGSTLVTENMLAFITTHTLPILLISFVSWTVIFQLLVLFTKLNVLKITVLVGTFALAMAFAGNDLVNFIGVPLAGFESFKAFSAAGGMNPDGFMMEALQAPVNTPIYFLIAAGLIMVLTLRFSKKAKSVTATTIDLSRQGEGFERFASSSLSRFIVRRSVEFSKMVGSITPRKVSKYVTSRFTDTPEPEEKKQEPVAFDMVRASVNLVVASILIAFGTSLKLPLSTTYVTFMVAMGTSLSDGAWGRESAVYRITGVLTVIGGWFFTAFSAFAVSFLIATIIFFGKIPVILVLIVLSIFILLRTHAFHKRKREKEMQLEREIITASYQVISSCNDEVRSTLSRVAKIHNHTYTSFFHEKHKELKKLRKESKKLGKRIKEVRNDLPATLKKFEEKELRSGPYYVQVVDYMKEMSNCLTHIVQPAYDHLDNNHPLDTEQSDQLKAFVKGTGEFFDFAILLLKDKKYGKVDDLVKRRDDLIAMSNDILLHRIKILKKKQKGVKVSVTYIEMLSETKNLLLHVVQLVKANITLLQSLVPIEKPMIEEVLD